MFSNEVETFICHYEGREVGPMRGRVDTACCVIADVVVVIDVVDPESAQISPAENSAPSSTNRTTTTAQAFRMPHDVSALALRHH